MPGYLHASAGAGLAEGVGRDRIPASRQFQFVPATGACGKPPVLPQGPWAARVQTVDATYDGGWDLPVIGPVSAPAAVLIRPDGHVAWVGDGTQAGLEDALARWFGTARG